MPLELPLNTMSVGEKVQLLEQVWDNLCHQSGDVMVRGQRATAETWQMKVGISSGAETDVGDGYWFYERDRKKHGLSLHRNIDHQPCGRSSES